MFSLIGMLVAVGAVALYVFVIAQKLATGRYEEGLAAVWDRDILEFFLIGIVLFGLGIVGEYVGRIYQQVRERPRYTVRAVLERDGATGDGRPHP